MLDRETVYAGPFAGMRLTEPLTGPPSYKLGSYEAELHSLISSWRGYDRILDVGCGHGWYVVGLGLRMPDALIWGFDVADDQLAQCRDMMVLNGVTATLDGAQTPESIARLISGRTLLFVDIEGAEEVLVDPEIAPGLRGADILVETHDFLRPGVTDLIRSRFSGRQVTVIEQAPRLASDYPILSGLDPAEAELAFYEHRPADLRWLWITA